MTVLRGFHHVALTVRDLAVSSQWYREVLGLEEMFREESEHRRAVVFRFPGGGHAVGLVQHASNLGGFHAERTGLDHLAFSVPSREDLEDWARVLDESQVNHSGVIDVPPGSILNFTDPDGIALALFWDR